MTKINLITAALILLLLAFGCAPKELPKEITYKGNTYLISNTTSTDIALIYAETINGNKIYIKPGTRNHIYIKLNANLFQKYDIKAVECTKEEDCVPAQCCHPTECVPAARSPDCKNIFCSMECAPNTMDCGQGKCICTEGFCEAEFLTQE